MFGFRLSLEIGLHSDIEKLGNSANPPLRRQSRQFKPPSQALVTDLSLIAATRSLQMALDLKQQVLAI